MRKHMVAVVVSSLVMGACGGMEDEASIQQPSYVVLKDQDPMRGDLEERRLGIAAVEVDPEGSLQNTPKFAKVLPPEVDLDPDKSLENNKRLLGLEGVAVTDLDESLKNNQLLKERDRNIATVDLDQSLEIHEKRLGTIDPRVDTDDSKAASERDRRVSIPDDVNLVPTGFSN
jgi:hypothetical protein